MTAVPPTDPRPAASSNAESKGAPPSQARKRWARGPARPQYLEGADVDHLLHIVIALMSEVSSLRDRLHSHELLAAEGVVATTAAVEAHVLTPEQRAHREQRRQAMLKRCLRVLTDQTESAGAHVSGQISGGVENAAAPSS